MASSGSIFNSFVSTPPRKRHVALPNAANVQNKSNKSNKPFRNSFLLRRITQRNNWRNKLAYKKRIRNYNSIRKLYNRTRGQPIHLVKQRENQGPLTYSQKKHINAATHPRQMIVTNRNEITNITRFPYRYTIGSTVSYQGNAQNDTESYRLVEHPNGSREFVLTGLLNNNNNNQNAGRRTRRARHF